MQFSPTKSLLKKLKNRRYQYQDRVRELTHKIQEYDIYIKAIDFHIAEEERNLNVNSTNIRKRKNGNKCK